MGAPPSPSSHGSSTDSPSLERPKQYSLPDPNWPSSRKQKRSPWIHGRCPSLPSLEPALTHSAIWTRIDVASLARPLFPSLHLREESEEDLLESSRYEEEEPRVPEDESEWLPSTGPS